MSINIIAPINQLGYGITGLNITKELANITETSLFVMGQPQITNEYDFNIINKCLQSARMPDFNAPCIRIWHQHDMSQFVGRGLKVGFPIFELDEFNDIEKHHLNSVDKLFVCSSWAKEVCERNLNIDKDNIHVIPLGVDTNVFKPCEPSGNTTTIFFNCGKWEIRKGHDLLPEIFSRAFTDDDDVELWMMCDNPFLNENETKEWINRYTNTKLGYKIRFINRLNTQEEVYNIMKNVDCGVFPSRAEGWNLELLELMSCGKHVITTNYAAHTEFCNSDNSMLVNTTETEKAYDGKWFNGQCGNWAKINDNNMQEFVHYMQNVHTLKKNGGLYVNTHGIETANKFTWKNSTENIIKYVSIL